MIFIEILILLTDKNNAFLVIQIPRCYPNLTNFQNFCIVMVENFGFQWQRVKRSCIMLIGLTKASLFECILLHGKLLPKVIYSWLFKQTFGIKYGRISHIQIS